MSKAIGKVVGLFVTLLLLVSTTGAQPAPGSYVARLSGLDMYYEVTGEGEPLLLLHGFNGSSRAWRPFKEVLAKEYLLVVPDLRGHGQSSNPSDRFTHRQSADDVFELLDHIGIQGFNAMGISTGGMTLIHMATSQPERLDAMVLIGSTHYFPAQARELMKKTKVETLDEEYFERMRRVHIFGDEQIVKLREQFRRFKDSYDDMNFTEPYLSTIQARTLIVHGDRDAFFPVSIPVAMYEAIPDSYLWIVPNGEHIPIYGKMAGPFLDTVREFFSAGKQEETEQP